jgi:hypothetical protein
LRRKSEGSGDIEIKMKKSPDDYFDDNDVATQIILELSKLYEDEDEWLDILMICIAKIIFNIYHPHQHEEVVDNLCTALKVTLKHVKVYED